MPLRLPIFLILLSVNLHAQVEPEPRLTLQTEEYLVGPVTLIGALAPSDTTFVSADFMVDGSLKCHVERLPLACSYDAGQGIARHQVVLWVNLPSGRQLTASFESKAMNLEYSAGVRNVFVPVVVWDWRERFMSGLTRDSFQVFEDGAAQTVQFFQAENVPLDLALALDISSSTASIIEEMKRATRQLMLKLKSIDRINLVAFNERTYVLARADASLAERLQAVDRLKSQGGTALVDAMLRGTELLGQQMSRRAMIVFTDGKDQHSLASFHALEERLAGTDISVYVIAYGRGSELETSRSGLDRLTDKTGGRTYHIKDGGDLKNVFSRIVDDLSQHYLLSYTPTREELDGSLRRIEVKLKGKSEREYLIKTRSGYRAVAPVIQ